MEKQSPVAHVIEILNQATDECRDILSAPEHGSFALMVAGTIKTLISRLSVSSGGVTASADAPALKPITNFMGEEISLPKKVTVADLKPDDAEKQAFIARVNQLYGVFNTIAPEGILNDYSRQEDIYVLRGVAKRAGVEDYADHEVNLGFIEVIGEAIKTKEANAKEQADIDSKLADDKKNANKK